MSVSIIKIAIADDSVFVRMGFVSLMKGYDTCDVILEAQNGKELIDTLFLLEQLPDICIIETSVEILNNYNTLVDLQKLFPTIKIIALSNYELEYTIIKLIQHGLRGYLLKKSSIDQLYTAIENVYSNGYYYSAIASESFFERALHETLSELSEEEFQLLSLTADEFNNTELPIAMFLQKKIIGESFHQIMNKLKCNDGIGLMTYMMQSGLIPYQHFI